MKTLEKTPLRALTMANYVAALEAFFKDPPPREDPGTCVLSPLDYAMIRGVRVRE